MKLHQVLTVILVGVTGALAGCQTKWYGTAPFCAGSCPSGCSQQGPRDNFGDGGYCVTGYKRKCKCCGPSIPDQAECIPKFTKTKCAGVVLICTNYESEAIGGFPAKQCGSPYACGGCIGIGNEPPPPKCARSVQVVGDRLGRRACPIV